MGDVGETFHNWKRYNKAQYIVYGINCPNCQIKEPKRTPTIMLPGQRCKVDGYVDPRPRLTEEQKEQACIKCNVPYFKRIVP